MLELERPDPVYERPQWLVVDRRIGEEFQVAEGISVHITDIDGGLVRLGIDAPGEVKILRAELEPLTADLQVQHREVQVESD